MEQTKHKSKHYVCKRLRLLEYLMRRGFAPITDVPDPTNWKYRHWIFENSPALETALEEYFEKITQNK